MRADLRLETFRSNYVYGSVDQVYACIVHGVDFDLEYIEWLWLKDFPQRAAKPHKQTLLHEIIHAVMFCYLEYSTRKFPEEEVPYYRELLTEAGIKIPAWLIGERVRSHSHELDRILSKASGVIVPSVFHVLFSDRAFLTQFQTRVAELTKKLKQSDYPALLAADGLFKRPTYLPTWLKAGIFHRDHGRCQHCWRDLTGLGEPVNDLHLDHIIPLAKSGTNDPTNFQLSCGTCNLTKGKKIIEAPAKFSPYW